ncbi:hypothetical protein N7453_007367 [Penicillium expansum]|nr:hypothetical protein N7453_007367 [Penicillium expansum]
MLILNAVALHFLVWWVLVLEKKHIPYTAFLSSHLFLVSTPFSLRVLLMHALSLVVNHSFSVLASPTHNGSLQCRIHVMGFDGMISGTGRTDK